MFALSPISFDYYNLDIPCVVVTDHIPEVLDYDYRKYKDEVTLFDLYSNYDEDDKHFCKDRLFLGSFFLSESYYFQKLNISLCSATDKDMTFCALMNKERPPRTLTSAWLHKNFNQKNNFTNYSQRFTGTEGLTQLLPLLEQIEDLNFITNKKSKLLSPKFIGRYLLDPMSENQSDDDYHMRRQNYKENTHNMERRSLINIITEPMFFEKGNVFTEKTIQACLSCNVPFFVNGYYTPDYFEQLGFHAFRDLIDYSAMDESNPIKRTIKLLDANKELLLNGFDYNKYKNEIEHNFYHVQDAKTILQKIYAMNDKTLFNKWYDDICKVMTVRQWDFSNTPVVDLYKNLKP